MEITVIGELCNDVFVYGETKRLSPEAPVPVFNPLHTEINPGMAGNVVENLRALNKDIKINFIHQKSPITKTRYVDDKSNHMFIRVDIENNIDELIMTEEVIKTISDSDAVIVSDYHKGFLSEEIVNDICFFSKFAVTDTKKLIGMLSLSCFDFVKLNEVEFNNHTINDKWLDKIIITLGSKGAKHMGVVYPSPDPKETIDVSGAGDTFTASFTLKYLETNDVSESIIFANKMASIVVSKRGVTTP
jgi:bifunctional ADP-heptose synthase (sugar kinase/adenylyltransferase)